MARERLVVWQRELHAAYDSVQAIGLGAGVLLVHQVCVMDDLRDLAQHRVAQEGVLLQEGFEGAIFPTVGEPGPYHIEELRPLRGLRRIAEEGEGGIRVYEAPYQPDAGGAVHVAPSASGPQHQTSPSSVRAAPVGASRSIAAWRAALSAAAASPLSGERK